MRMPVTNINNKKSLFLVILLATFALYYLLSPPKDILRVGQALVELPRQQQRHSDETECVSADMISTCSCKTDQRGLHQNVIGFSLYGDLNSQGHWERYVAPLISAVETISQVYPDWDVRIYTKFEEIDGPSYQRFLDVFQVYPNVDVCNTTAILKSLNISLDVFPMTWRFLPLLDPMVDNFMSRDSDSQISTREVDAVREWMTDNATFHFMRDSPYHCVEILGGLWGTKLSWRRQEIAHASKEMFQRRLNKKLSGIDQILLSLYIWPLAKDDMVAHDSYCCLKFPPTRPFPTQREGNIFTGSISIDHGANPQLCPEACRPIDHLDWIFC